MIKRRCLTRYYIAVFSLCLTALTIQKLWHSVFTYQLLVQWNPYSKQSSFAQPPACLWPHLDPWDPSIRPWLKHPSRLVCPEVQPNLAYLDLEGYLHVIPNDTLTSDIKCYTRRISGTLYPRSSRLEFGPEEPININEATKVHDDIFELSCFPENASRVHFQNEIYRQAFMQITPKAKKYVPSSESKLSVDIMVLDSVSWPQFRRHMTKTLSFMRDTMGFLFFEQAAKVGDNTLVNIVPLLTGKKLVEPTYAKLDNISSDFSTFPLNSDKDLPFIWRDFADADCVTMFNVDPVNVGYGFLFYPSSFVHGFSQAPTDYYFRPGHYYYVAHYWGSKRQRFCRGNFREPDVVLFNIARQWYHRYANTCHFSLTLAFHDFSHDVPYDVERLDEEFLEFFQELHKSNKLNNTVFLFMGDHGHRLSLLRNTFQGQLEERMSFFSLYFPPWFREKHSDLWKNLQKNTARYVTHYDLHETLRDIQHGRFTGRSTTVLSRGMSLFDSLPEDRTCSSADTPRQFCVCLEPRDEKKNDDSNPKFVRNAQRLIAEWLQKSETCKSCGDSQVNIKGMKSFIPSDFIRHRIRHFDDEAKERLKRPAANPVEFLWTVAEIKREDGTPLQITTVIQHTIDPETFKINKSPEVTTIAQ